MEITLVKNSKSQNLTWYEQSTANHHIRSLVEFQGLVTPNWFEPEYWLNNNKVTGTSKGRFTTYFIQQENNQDQQVNMVLRHYYRGGLVRHFSKDSFIYTGLQNTRAVQEFNLLLQMWELGLPVPKPLAVQVSKKNLFWYNNSILIERISDAKDAFNLLRLKPLAPTVWKEMGKVIRRFHDHEVFHADLNIHNILISNQQDITLIDFDRCSFRKEKQSNKEWKQQNLSRLKRSLEKEYRLNQPFNYNEQDWQTLLEGYKK